MNSFLKKLDEVKKLRGETGSIRESAPDTPPSNGTPKSNIFLQKIPNNQLTNPQKSPPILCLLQETNRTHS